MFHNQKVLGEEKKDWIVTWEENHSYWKTFHAKSYKKHKIFFCTPVRTFQKTSKSATKQNRFIKKKQKKPSKKRYSTSFRSSHPKVLWKKGVLENFITCLFAYCLNRHPVVNKNLPILQNPSIRNTALSSIFYFEKVLLFWRSINKNVWEWFLLITSKEYTLYIHWPDLQTFFVETMPSYVFD